MRILKRDGSLQPFEVNKVKRCLLMAFDASDIQADVMPIVHTVVSVLLSQKKETVTVADIQFVIEDVLSDCGFSIVAEHYRQYRKERDRLREQRLTPDPECLKDFIFRDKYSLRGETWEECVTRTRDMHLRKFKNLSKDLKDEIIKAFDFVIKKEVLPSMRSLQFGGAAIEAHNARMYNCSYTAINRITAFDEILYLLLCGCGVGFSVRWEHVEQLPKLSYIDKKNVWHHHIEDNIEGWADAVYALFDSYMCGSYVEFDYSSIRKQGSELKTSGGIAPGHLGLKATLEAVRCVLDKAQGRFLRPIEVYDIVCHLAECVVAGGIRRSSLIALFSPVDMEMMYAKTAGCFHPTKFNKQRCLCNNTVVFDPDVVTEYDISRVLNISQGYGEPGFAFLKLHEGINPCGEIILTPFDSGFGFCNLVEVWMGSENLAEAIKAATIIATLQATYTDFNYLSVESKQGAERDALIGVSLTGLLDYPERLQSVDFKNLYDLVIVTNESWAITLGINPADRHTCIKPSGTASLLLGCSNGIHPRYARRYLRRVIVAPDDEVAKQFISQNPHMLERSDSGKEWLVFPVQAPDTSITLKELTTVKHLEYIFKLLDYVDHSISCTVVTTPEDFDTIIPMIYARRKNLATMAFAPPSLETKYPYAPFEAIVDAAGETYWNMLITNYRPVKWKDTNRADIGAACDGERCEVKERDC